MKTPQHVLDSLEDFNRWSSGDGFGLLDYAMCVGTPDVLCAMLELASPALVEYEGDYFLAHGFDREVVEDWRKQLPSIVDVQKVVNHVHISAFVQGQPVIDETAVHIATGIAHVWSLTLAKFGLAVEASGSGLSDAQVTFFRRREG